MPFFYFTAVTVSRGTTSVDGVQNSREYTQTTAFTIALGPAQHTHSGRRSRGRPEILTGENMGSGSILLTGAIGVLVYFKSGQRFARVVAASTTFSVSFAAALFFTATTVRVSAFVGGVQNSSVRPKTNRRGRPSLFALWAVYSRPWLYSRRAGPTVSSTGRSRRPVRPPRLAARCPLPDLRRHSVLRAALPVVTQIAYRGLPA